MNETCTHTHTQMVRKETKNKESKREGTKETKRQREREKKGRKHRL